MAKTLKKIMSLILSLLMIFSSVTVALAAEPETENKNVTVNIISFMRGAQNDLRSSELLEAHVEGYDGNVRELTYKWYTTLGTYLYVYNSHNMYNINNSEGEVEVYNSSKLSALGNMGDRSYKDSFSGVGYAWASVYGANLKGSTSLVGTVTVEVYDKDGNLLCSDSHTGTYANKKNSGFVTYDLDADMHNVVLGLFEGDKRNVKDLLGESAIVHITCTASSVSGGSVERGDEYISLTKENNEYYIKGIKAGSSTDSNGDALVNLTIKKGNCKFHNNDTGTAKTTVYVFKRPTTETTTTTLTLTGNLDSRCKYFIGGVEGTKQDDGTIIFTGLTPNTAYTVEVRGEYIYKDGADKEILKYAYAFVYDTTKPVYKATVYTHLDGVLTDIFAIHGADVNLYLREDSEDAEFIPLDKTAEGVYTADVVNGVYYPWHIEDGDHYHQAKEYKLIVQNANGELHLHHYSVNYNTNGGAFKQGEEVSREIFPSGASAVATKNVPVKEGYIFTGWEYNGKLIAPGEQITSGITSPVTLTAQWEKAVNVTINVTINHKVAGGYDHNANKDELLVEFLEMKAGDSAFNETGYNLYFTQQGVVDANGYSKDYDYIPEVLNGVVLSTTYRAIAPTYTGMLESSSFGVAVGKSGYDLTSVNKTKDKNGNWTIDILLNYNPSSFDIGFSVKMDEDVPKELYPDAVIVKIACWDVASNQWLIISQQRTTELATRPGVRVNIDKETGIGTGTYPVWMHDSTGNPYGYRAVITGFVYKDSTLIVPTEKNLEKNENEVIVAYTDGNYTATMGEIQYITLRRILQPRNKCTAGYS